MHYKNIILCLLLSLMTVSCSNNNEDEFIALIGDTFIKESDITQTIEVETLYRGESISRKVALVILINDTLELEIGRSAGVQVTLKELETFSNSVDNKTEDKEVLRQVKEVFNNNIDAYNKLYLTPRILNRKIRNIYSNDKNMHRIEIKAIEKAKSLIDSGTSFEEAAEKSKTEYFKRDLEIEDSKTDIPVGNLPSGVKGYMEETKKYTPKDSLVYLVKTMKEGATFNNIIEDESSYKILKLLKNNDTSFTIEVVVAKKKAIDVWFKEQGTSIKIQVVDTELKKVLQNQYTNMWWIEKI